MSSAAAPYDPAPARGRAGRRSPRWADLAVLEGADWVDQYLGQTLLFAPRPRAAGEQLVPFAGRYEEQPLAEMLADRGYVAWLVMKAWWWLPKKHPEVWDAVLRAQDEPPPDPGLGPLIYSGRTMREASEYLDANAWPRYRTHYRLLSLDMDDDPANLYIYLRDAESVVYYALHEETGIIKIGTSSWASLRISSLRYAQALPGRWTLLAFEPGDRDLEQQRHLEFREHKIALKPDGRRARELFKPALALAEHIAAVLQGCREWPNPEPHISFNTAYPFNRVVLSDQAPRSGLVTDGVPDELTSYMKNIHLQPHIGHSS